MNAIALILATLTTLSALNSMLLAQTTLNQNKTLTAVQQPPLFLQIAKRFADTHPYINNTYTCVNFSKDFAELGKLLDYKVIKVCGHLPNVTDEGHCWDKVWWNGSWRDFEPQDGVFVNFSNYILYNKGWLNETN